MKSNFGPCWSPSHGIPPASRCWPPSYSTRAFWPRRNWSFGRQAPLRATTATTSATSSWPRAILTFTTPREGLYDQLPHALFHAPEAHDPGRPLDDRLEGNRLAREREAEARMFFLPFEQEFYRVGVATEQTERQLLDAFRSPLYRRLLRTTWVRCTRVPRYSLPLLSYILPLAYRIAGDLPLMTACYRAVLGAEVTLEYVTVATPPTEVVDVGFQGRRLGVDFELGGTLPAELPQLELRIGPLPRESTEEFLPGREGDELLLLLNECLVPYEVDVRPVFLFAQADESLRLGGGDVADSRLGLTSRLTLPT